MSVLVSTVRRINQFCISQMIYPLALCSLLACAIYAGRVYLSHQHTYHFLIWNLFLAWIPFGCSLLIVLLHHHHPHHGWLLVIPGALWLLVLPNAPYLVTDLWHLDERLPVPLWYDIAMLATFAWSGLFIGIASLSSMQNVIAHFFGRLISWFFVFAAIGLSGLGIYLGRFLKWNSWDFFFQPRSILTDVVVRFAHPTHNPGPVGFTLLFAAFILICYITFASIKYRLPERAKN
jgi:uncharacterized membrane protein